MEQTPCVRIGHLSIIDHLILGIALKEVETNDTALPSCKIQAVPSTSWEQISDALFHAELDAAFITAPLAMSLFRAGINIRLLMFVHRSGSLIVKTRTPLLKHLDDFKAKTILIPSELSVQHMLLHRLFSSAGLSLGKEGEKTDIFTETAYPFLMPHILKSGAAENIAGMAVSDPYATQAIKNGDAGLLCTTDALWRHHPCCSLVVRNTLLENEPEAISDIVALFCKSAQKLHLSMDEDIRETAQVFLNIDNTTLTDVLENSGICFDPKLLVPDMKALESIMMYMIKQMGIMDQAVDLDQLVDNRYILNILPELIH